MIEQVLQPRNLERALQQVISNKGSAGIDGMKVSELTDYMRNNKAQLMQEIKEDKYLPSFIRGKEIPKVVKIKYYTSFNGDLMPNGICRYFYKEREGDLDYIETQEKCDCYNVGDTIR